jgi:hypothetical protein
MNGPDTPHPVDTEKARNTNVAAPSRHDGAHQALGELRRMVDRGHETGRPAFILARQKTGGMNVSSEGHCKISHDHGADMGRANALARRLVMIRAGL